MGQDDTTNRVKYLFGKVTNLQSFIQQHKKKFIKLTQREVEILTMIARGMNNAAIASELCISRATVQNHRSSIRNKLSITSQVDYIKYALAFGLIHFDED